jgi:NDP-hexose-3-ketoreductase
MAILIAHILRSNILMILNVGVLACSSMARRRFLPAISKIPTLKIWRVGSRDREKALTYSRLFNSTYFGSYEDVIYDPKIQLVYISAPPHLHYELSIAALKEGKHVICEKPIAGNLHDLKILNEIATSNRALFAEHYSFTYHPQNILVKKLVSNGHIGKPRYINASFHYPMPASTDIRLNSEICGGVLHDSIGYPVLAALSLIDGEVSLLGSNVTIDQAFNIDRSCCFKMKVDEVEVTGDVSMGKDYQAFYEVNGDSGSILVSKAYSVDDKYEAKIIETTFSGKKFYSVDKSNQIENFLFSFIENINQNIKAGSYKNSFYQTTLRLRGTIDKIIEVANYN